MIQHAKEELGLGHTGSVLRDRPEGRPGFANDKLLCSDQSIGRGSVGPDRGGQGAGFYCGSQGIQSGRPGDPEGDGRT